MQPMRSVSTNCKMDPCTGLSTSRCNKPLYSRSRITTAPWVCPGQRYHDAQQTRRAHHCSQNWPVPRLLLHIFLRCTKASCTSNMAKTSTAEVVELNTLASTRHDSVQQSLSETDPVAKIGHTLTVPRTLDRLVALIGVNSSVVCPWPNFYFVATLNLANGGIAGLLVGTIVACIGMAPVYLSLAEKLRKCAALQPFRGARLTFDRQVSDRWRTIPLGGSTSATQSTEVPQLPLLLHPHIHMALIPRSRRLAFRSGRLSDPTDSYRRVPYPKHLHSGCLCTICRLRGQHYMGQTHEHSRGLRAGNTCCGFLPPGWVVGVCQCLGKLNCQPRLQ